VSKVVASKMSINRINFFSYVSPLNHIYPCITVLGTNSLGGEKMSSYETPVYAVKIKDGSFELRQYDKFQVVRVDTKIEMMDFVPCFNTFLARMKNEKRYQ